MATTVNTPVTLTFNRAGATPRFTLIDPGGEVTRELSGVRVSTGVHALTFNPSRVGTWRVVAEATGTGAASAQVVTVVDGLVADPLPPIDATDYGATGDGTTDDTAAIQAAINAANAAGGGTVSFPAGTFITTGLTLYSEIHLRGVGPESSAIKLAANTNGSVILTDQYATHIATDTTSGPRDFSIRDLTIDGNRTNQASASGPALGIHGRSYVIDNVIIQNAYGDGFHTMWGTASPFITPNGFESFITRLKIIECNGSGLKFEGPHDTHVSDMFIMKCGKTSAAYPLYVASSAGRASGCNFSNFHIYGGEGYNYGLVCNESGIRFVNIVVEGAVTAQVMLWAAQIQIDGAHLYSGSISVATVKGLIFGDGSHTNINGCTLTGIKVENCGNGAIDFAQAGLNNTVEAHEFWTSGTAPTTLGLIGTIPAQLRLSFQSSDQSYVPTTSNQMRVTGFVRVIAADAANPALIVQPHASHTGRLVEFRNPAGTAQALVNKEGRFAYAGTAPTLAAGANNGTSPPTPTNTSTSNDMMGGVNVGSGTGPAAGAQAVVTFSAAYVNTPKVMLMPANAATQALGLYVSSPGTGSFTISSVNAPAASQSVGTYQVYYHVFA